MSNKQTEEYLENIAELKAEWLADKGFTLNDVMCDDDGVEYIVDIMEMDEGEGGDYSKKRIDLPDFKQE